MHLKHHRCIDKIRLPTRQWIYRSKDAIQLQARRQRVFVVTKRGSHSKLVNNGGCSVDAAEMAVVITSGHISSFKEEQDTTQGFSPLLTDFGKSLAKLCRASWLAIRAVTFFRSHAFANLFGYKGFVLFYM